jgi:hypothetical protein
MQQKATKKNVTDKKAVLVLTIYSGIVIVCYLAIYYALTCLEK